MFEPTDRPRRVLVTGAGGFLAHGVIEQLRSLGAEVVGVDCNLDGERQRSNLADARLVARSAADLADLPIRSGDAVGTTTLVGLLDGVDAVVHLAGTPGVQTSWSDGFEAHTRNNIVATQRLCEAALDTGVGRIVVASSSSVYGSVASGLAAEDDELRPLSPYGASKAAMEHVVRAYAARGLDVVALRYFTVYGPHQRPDMAIHRMIEAARGGAPFPMRGDGAQARSFTYVADAAAATVTALDADLPSGVPVNVGGDEVVSVRRLLDLVAELGGRPVPVDHRAARPGDPERTAADGRRARELLGWTPTTPLEDGLARQWAWHGARAGRAHALSS